MALINITRITNYLIGKTYRRFLSGRNPELILQLRDRTYVGSVGECKLSIGDPAGLAKDKLPNGFGMVRYGED